MSKFFSLLKVNQSGFMLYFLIAIIALLFLFYFSRMSYSPVENTATQRGEHFCRELVNDPSAPRIQGPVYTGAGVNTSQQTEYKMIKQNVPVPYYFLVKTPKEHFFNDYEEVYTNPTGKKFLKKIPNGEGGQSYKLKDETGTEQYLTFADYGLFFLFHLNEDETPVELDNLEIEPGNFLKVMVADIYKAVDKPDLPDWVLKCVDTQPNGFGTYKKAGAYFPDQNKSVDEEELQLQYFLLRDYTLMLQAWWTPHCKPAVYLYPSKPMMVNVKVRPNGYLTYVDPKYDEQLGWNVMAYPNGTLINQSSDTDNLKVYDYLYFESKIKNQLVTKPEKGWIIEYEKLSEFYNHILPQLNFNQKQQTDFIEYWQKALPQSPYYFVSLIEPEEINTYETLNITPTPDSVNRVRFYFEPRDSFSHIATPDISQFTTQSKGEFTVFEWGGMFKRHKNEPFTCGM